MKPKDIPDYLPASLGVLWLWSGIQPLLTARDVSLQLLSDVGIPEPLRMLVLVSASLLDIALGAGCFGLLKRHAWFWAVQLVVVAAYSLVIVLCLSESLLHPFAPVLKNLPVAALMFYLMRRSEK